MKLLSCLIVYCQTLPNIWNKDTVIDNNRTLPETLHIKYTSVPFIYKNVGNLIVCLSFQRSSSVPTEEKLPNLEYAKSLGKKRASVVAGSQKYGGE
jgi:hypothetical protein